MSPADATPALQALLAAFETAAGAARETEAFLRQQLEAEILRLERQRAFAYRRLSFVRVLSESIQLAENTEAALAKGRAAVRTELGWHSDSETRTETLTRLAPLFQATFACLGSAADASPTEVVKALDAFEAWYETRFEQSFWSLFDQHIEEMPLVER
jgi:hypothetical protein